MSATEPDQLLILDTCGILDIVRLATRPNSRAADILTVLASLHLASSDPRRLGVAVTTEVATEYDHHKGGVESTTKAELRRAQTSIQHAAAVAEHLGHPTPLVVHETWADDLLERSVALAARIIDVAEIIESTQEDRNGAWARSAGDVAPARRGASIYDCAITETSLRVARGRPPGSTYFLSSNVNDFLDSARRRLKPPLDVEFPSAGLEFLRNWGEAHGKLSLSQSRAQREQ